MNRSIPTTFYGDDSRWFVATVVNVVPPPGLEGRVKIRVYGIHNLYTGEIPEKDLPWAQVSLPTTEGGVSGIGKITNLSPGAFVYGIFLDGKSSQIPLVLGSMSKVEFPSIVQSKLEINQDSFKTNQEKIINQVVEEILDETDRVGDADLRRNQCVKFFLDNGYKLVHAAAIAGNLQSLSNFTLYSDQDESSQGIGQWSNLTEIGRFRDLIEFAKIYEPSSSWKRYSIQLQFVLHELRGKFVRANYLLKQTDYIEDAVEKFSRAYLKQIPIGRKALQLSEKAYDEAIAE